MNTNNLSTEGQKVCKLESRGCREQITIDSVVKEQCKRNKKNLTAYIDYQEAFGIAGYSMFKLDPILVSCLQNNMAKWKNTMTSRTEMHPDHVHLQRGIFLGNSVLCGVI